MSLAMQVSGPLALYLIMGGDNSLKENAPEDDLAEGSLRTPRERRTIRQFTSTRSQILATEATGEFANLFYICFKHPDWAQMHEFFFTRYDEKNPSNASDRILPSPKTPGPGEPDPVPVNLNTRPNSIGLPDELIEIMAKATNLVCGPMGIPFWCVLGPALSVGIGPAAYMDLIYSSHPQGSGPPSTQQLPYGLSKGDGRGRGPREWRELWQVIADWVYDFESARIAPMRIPSPVPYDPDDGWASASSSSDGADSDDEPPRVGAFMAVNGIWEMFFQLTDTPQRFFGIEWDFLDMDGDPHVRTAFFRRFGPRPPSPSQYSEDMSRNISLSPLSTLSYNTVRPDRLRPCPDTRRGIDWERWLLSIEGGCVIEVRTVFQALWAVMLLTYFPLEIMILDDSGVFPGLLDPNCIYL